MAGTVFVLSRINDVATNVSKTKHWKLGLRNAGFSILNVTKYVHDKNKLGSTRPAV